MGRGVCRRGAASLGPCGSPRSGPLLRLRLPDPWPRLLPRRLRLAGNVTSFQEVILTVAELGVAGSLRAGEGASVLKRSPTSPLRKQNCVWGQHQTPLGERRPESRTASRGQGRGGGSRPTSRSAGQVDRAFRVLGGRTAGQAARTSGLDTRVERPGGQPGWWSSGVGHSGDGAREQATSAEVCSGVQGGGGGESSEKWVRGTPRGRDLRAGESPCRALRREPGEGVKQAAGPRGSPSKHMSDGIVSRGGT